MKNILIVEDDLTIRETLAELLMGEGYTVVTKENGKAALGYLKSGVVLPSLILLDLMMPVMDGWELRALLAEDKATMHIPVVIITAAGTVKEKAEFTNVKGWIRKPIVIDELLGTISKYI